MNKPRILLPLAVAGLVLTAALVNAREVPAKAVPVADAVCPPAEWAAMFKIAPMTVSKRAKLILANPVLLQAEVDALFKVAPKTASKPVVVRKIR